MLGEDREIQVIGLVVMSLGFKLIRAATWEEFLALFFMFGKLGFLVLYILNSHRMAWLYGGLCAITWVAL